MVAHILLTTQTKQSKVRRQFGEGHQGIQSDLWPSERGVESKEVKRSIIGSRWRRSKLKKDAWILFPPSPRSVSCEQGIPIPAKINSNDYSKTLREGSSEVERVRTLAGHTNKEMIPKIRARCTHLDEGGPMIMSGDTGYGKGYSVQAVCAEYVGALSNSRHFSISANSHKFRRQNTLQ
ncbi:hypothetical protein CAPTEDRAFT_189906 [Capitella teleta]|uniref:Uncharacterized protein n=1 Tax=Capitella teleta TaxID=283909 RepID=R7VES3_CAPTE|nr:hypothetical protein CAPTEDRAFT_189906 [Capitella teleta]|eukprot:ELU17343.1 hypothetical protein CAPTEDRAFT_189906 [Capitella teleta]